MSTFHPCWQSAGRVRKKKTKKNNNNKKKAYLPPNKQYFHKPTQPTLVHRLFCLPLERLHVRLPSRGEPNRRVIHLPPLARSLRAGERRRWHRSTNVSSLKKRRSHHLAHRSPRLYPLPRWLMADEQRCRMLIRRRCSLLGWCFLNCAEVMNVLRGRCALRLWLLHNSTSCYATVAFTRTKAKFTMWGYDDCNVKLAALLLV